MGYLLFFGCLFIAFAPIIAIFALVLSKSPQLVIISIGSSFFWMLSVLIASIWWYIIPPLRDQFAWIIIWAVLIQEAMRFAFFKLYAKGEKGLVQGAKTTQLTAHPDHLKTALAFGVGSGVSHCLVMYVSVLWEATGPGSYFSPSCPNVNLFGLSAVYALFFVLFHICWALVGFDAFRRSSWKILGAVAGHHVLVSYLSMLNMNGASCYAAVFLLLAVLIMTALFTWITVLRSSEAVRRQRLLSPDD